MLANWIHFLASSFNVSLFYGNQSYKLCNFPASITQQSTVSSSNKSLCDAMESLTFETYTLFPDMSVKQS